MICYGLMRLPEPPEECIAHFVCSACVKGEGAVVIEC